MNREVFGDMIRHCLDCLFAFEIKILEKTVKEKEKKKLIQPRVPNTLTFRISFLFCNS